MDSRDSSCINNSTIFHMHKRLPKANLLWQHLGANIKELCDLQTWEKEGVVVRKDNGRLPGLTGRVLMPNYPNTHTHKKAPFFPFSFPKQDKLTVNEWTHSYSQQSWSKGSGLQSHWTWTRFQTHHQLSAFCSCSCINTDKHASSTRLKPLQRATCPR